MIYKSFENGIRAQSRRWDVNKLKKETTWLTCFLLSVYTLNISVGMNYTCWQNNRLQFITSTVKITRDWWRRVSKLRANPLSSNEFSIPLNPADMSLRWCEISAFNFRTSTEDSEKTWRNERLIKSIILPFIHLLMWNPYENKQPEKTDGKNTDVKSLCVSLHNFRRFL